MMCAIVLILLIICATKKSFFLQDDEIFLIFLPGLQKFCEMFRKLHN